MDNWISVNNELPVIGKTVIVDGGIARRTVEGWRSLTAAEYPGRLICWDVTHWQPLPKLPNIKSDTV